MKVMLVHDKAEIFPGDFTTVGFTLTDVKRVNSVNRKSSEGEKQIRGRIRAKRKGHDDTCNEIEGEGVFCWYFTIYYFILTSILFNLVTAISEESQFLNSLRM